MVFCHGEFEKCAVDYNDPMRLDTTWGRHTGSAPVYFIQGATALPRRLFK